MARGQSASTGRAARSEGLPNITKKALDKEVWRESPADKALQQRELKKYYPNDAERNQLLKEAKDSVERVVSDVGQMLNSLNTKDYSEKTLKTIYDAGVKIYKWQQGDLRYKRDFFTSNQTTALDLAYSSISRAARAIETIQNGEKALDRRNLVNADLMSPETMADLKRGIVKEIANARKMLKAATID